MRGPGPRHVLRLDFGQAMVVDPERGLVSNKPEGFSRKKKKRETWGLLVFLSGLLYPCSVLFHSLSVSCFAHRSKDVDYPAVYVRGNLCQAKKWHHVYSHLGRPTGAADGQQVGEDHVEARGLLRPGQQP